MCWCKSWVRGQWCRAQYGEARRSRRFLQVMPREWFYGHVLPSEAPVIGPSSSFSKMMVKSRLFIGLSSSYTIGFFCLSLKLASGV